MIANFTGQLLIAMPQMRDPRFVNAVVLMCSHSDDGAMGLIINKPIEDPSFDELAGQLGIETPCTRAIPVLFGGPVEPGRGFVLHNDSGTDAEGTLEVPGGYAMTATLDAVEEIADGRGPDRAVMTLGYAGWSPGQLESEIADNGWLTCESDPDLVFGTDMDGKWSAALAKLGVSPLTLSPDAGRA